MKGREFGLGYGRSNFRLLKSASLSIFPRIFASIGIQR
jgi:hypothetical protein